MAHRVQGREADLEGVLTRLEALLAQERPQADADLAPIGNAGLRSNAAPSRRVPLEQPSASNGLEEILERLTAIERRLSVRPTGAQEMQPLDRLRAPDVEAIRAAIEFKEADRDAAQLDTRTMHEVLKRFGYPTEAESCGGGNCDIYGRYDLPSANPDDTNYFSVHFKTGLVVWTEGRWTD